VAAAAHRPRAALAVTHLLLNPIVAGGYVTKFALTLLTASCDSRLFQRDMSEVRGKLRANLVAPNPAAIVKLTAG